MARLHLSSHLVLAALVFGAAPAAFAQEGEGDALTGWGFEATAGGASDYRYRGVSQSDGDAAIQAELSFYSPSGFYAYGWASEVDYGIGDDLELMTAFGWSGAVLADALTLDLAANSYFYPGINSSTLFEASATLTQTWRDYSFSAGLAYFPDQDNLGGLDNVYVSTAATAPLGLWGVEGTLGLGWEDGAFGDEKVDWLLAADIPISAVKVRLAYVGSNADRLIGPNADDTVLMELRYNLGWAP